MPFSRKQCFTADSTAITTAVLKCYNKLVHVNYQYEAIQNHIVMLLYYSTKHKCRIGGLALVIKSLQMGIMGANIYYQVKQNVANLYLS